MMNGWIVDEWMDKRTYMYVYMDEWMEGRKEERVDGWMGKNIWMGKWGMDGWVDGDWIEG